MKQDLDHYRRRQGYRRHLKRRGYSWRARRRHRRLAEIDKCYMGYYITEEGLVKRVSRRRMSKYLKHYSDKKVRKAPCGNRGGYRKVFDFSWELD